MSYGSYREIYWVCPTGLKTHNHICRVWSRAIHKIGCPKCAVKRGKAGRPKKRGRLSIRRASLRPIATGKPPAS